MDLLDKSWVLMKICLTASGFPPVPPVGTGAVEYDVFGLAVALTKLGHDVYIVDTSDNYKRNTAQHLPSVKLCKVKHPHFLSKLIYQPIHACAREIIRHCTQISFSTFSTSILSKFILKNKIDLFNPHHRYSGFFGIITKKLLSLKIPIVFSTHNSLWIKNHISPQMKLFLLPETICLKASTRVTAVSETLRRYVIKHLSIDPEKITTIYNGVDASIFRPNPNTKRVADPFPLILFVSTIRKIKNQIAAVKIMPEIVQSFPQAKLVFIGSIYDPSYYYDIMNLARKLLVEKNVIYLGERRMFDLPKYFNSADIVIFPTTLESSFPRVLMEALSCGKAAVVSDIPAIREVLPKDVAIMVNPTDTKAMALAVISILADKNLKRTLELKARRFATQKFDWVSIAKAYENVFAESLAVS
jgi:glycosyltransferase involved in cell wall biosynthesis